MEIINDFDKFKKLSLLVESVEYNKVIYKRHKNPDGSIGGFVAITAKVEKSVFIEIGRFISHLIFSQELMNVETYYQLLISLDLWQLLDLT